MPIIALHRLKLKAATAQTV